MQIGEILHSFLGSLLLQCRRVDCYFEGIYVQILFWGSSFSFTFQSINDEFLASFPEGLHPLSKRDLRDYHLSFFDLLIDDLFLDLDKVSTISRSKVCLLSFLFLLLGLSNSIFAASMPLKAWLNRDDIPQVRYVASKAPILCKGEIVFPERTVFEERTMNSFLLEDFKQKRSFNRNFLSAEIFILFHQFNILFF